jgi:hypothetical protein
MQYVVNPKCLTTAALTLNFYSSERCNFKYNLKYIFKLYIKFVYSIIEYSM